MSMHNYCAKIQVRALIVKDGEVVSHGMNTPVKKCDNVSCHVEGHCVNTNHAEVVAILQAGGKAEGATMFVSHEPCHTCRKVIIASGIKTVVYHNKKFDELNHRFRGNVEWIHEPLGEGDHATKKG